MTESSLVRTVISRKIANAIRIGVMKTNEPKILKEFGGCFELIESSARNVLKNMD